MRGCLPILFLLSSTRAALWEEDGRVDAATETNGDAADAAAAANSEVAPRGDFVRITRASGERHERQISRRLQPFGDGERHFLTVDRNGNVLQFRRPPPSSFFPPPISPSFSPSFRSFPPQRGFTRPRFSHGFSRRRPLLTPPVTPRPPPFVTHDGSMATVLAPTLESSEEQETQFLPPTVTREGTVTNGLRRIPPGLRSRGRIDSVRLVHGGSTERFDLIDRPTVPRPIDPPGPQARPLRVSSSFEALSGENDDRFRVGGPPIGEFASTAPSQFISQQTTTPLPSTRVFIQTPRPFRPRPPPRQRPIQPPRRVETIEDDDQQFVPSGRSGVSPSVVSPFRSFRPRIPPSRFTLPPRSPFRSGPLPSIHNSPLPSTSSSTTLSSPSTTTTVTTTPSTTLSTTEATTTTMTTTPSTTTVTEPSTSATTAITSALTTTMMRNTTVSASTFTRRPTTSLTTLTTSIPTTRDSPPPVSPFFHSSSSFHRPDTSTTVLPSPTFPPLQTTDSTTTEESTTVTSPSPFLPTDLPATILKEDPIEITEEPTTASTDGTFTPPTVETTTVNVHQASPSLSHPSTLSSHLPSTLTSTSPISSPSSPTTPPPPSSSSPSSSPNPSTSFRDSPSSSPSPLLNQQFRIITTSRSSLSTPQFEPSDLPDEFDFESSDDDGPPISTTPSTLRAKLTPTPISKPTVAMTSTFTGKTTIALKSTTVTPPSSPVTPASKTRRIGTTTIRGFATVSPSISVKSLPPAIPEELTFNSIRGPIPPAIPSSSSLAPHSTTSRPPASAPAGPPSTSLHSPPSPSFDGPPGEMPPSDNVVQMLNEADDFMEMARRLNITRKARIARRRRRMAEYGRSQR